MAQGEIFREVISMIVTVDKNELMKLIGEKLSVKTLEDTLFLMKAEIERVDGNEIQIEINPDRQDMLSVEGLARAIRAFLEIETGLKEFPVTKSGKKIIVGKGLEKIRKYISCGIVRDVEINNNLVKEYMQLQEALTATHGRNRRKASIGLYVFDDIKFPIHYTLRKPEKISFVPLGHEDVMDGNTILEQHEKGIEYGHIISTFPKWPLLVDSEDQVLSLPPVINSNTLGKITENTTNIFVEVTGTHLPTVNQALNIMVTSLAQRKGSIESLSVIYPDETKETTPNLLPLKMTVTKQEVKELLGLDLDDDEILRSMGRVGYNATIKGQKITVEAPAYRTDILHPVDVIEDLAIGYGFDRIIPTMPSSMTQGKLQNITRLKNKVRDLMVGMEFQEILSYIMTSPTTLTEKMLRKDPIVVTTNPRSRDYSVLRNALLPILMDFASLNQHADLPQRIFEVGDVVVPNESKETRTDQIPSICGLVTDVKVNITDLMKDIGYLLRNLDLDGKFKFVAQDDSTFIAGRTAQIVVNNKVVGFFGEIAPEVLSNFGISSPIVAFELQLPRNCQW
ncbi:phenylalanine--tRNA ligase subunit beta [Candidatus Thorarchaeota archaeon]|nr:MAG: phenylalanine--tRNA ligase subunit beta [Candidatus Thorarchaeota archaeon]